MTTHKAERYDYEHQAWIGTDGRYLCCAHPEAMNCRCYGKFHAGELAEREQAQTHALPGLKPQTPKREGVL